MNQRIPPFLAAVAFFAATGATLAVDIPCADLYEVVEAQTESSAYALVWWQLEPGDGGYYSEKQDYRHDVGGPLHGSAFGEVVSPMNLDVNDLDDYSFAGIAAIGRVTPLDDGFMLERGGQVIAVRHDDWYVSQATAHSHTLAHIVFKVHQSARVRLTLEWNRDVADDIPEGSDAWEFLSGQERSLYRIGDLGSNDYLEHVNATRSSEVGPSAQEYLRDMSYEDAVEEDNNVSQGNIENRSIVVDLEPGVYLFNDWGNAYVRINDDGNYLDVQFRVTASFQFEGKVYIADLDADDMVDGSDLNILLGAWGTDDPCADLNEDGLVDGGDLNILLGEWS